MSLVNMKTIILLILSAACARVATAQSDTHAFNVDGIDVILRPVAANNVVSVICFIKGGTSYLPATESVALEGLTLGIAASSGTTGMTKDQYQNKLTKMVSTIAGSAGDDYSTFSFRSVKESFSDTWDLFAGVITSPSFDSVEIKNSKRNTITEIKSIKSSPDSYVSYLADSLYFDGHPYARRPSIGEVKEITAKDLQAHFKELFVKSRLLLVVVGNIDQGELKQKIESSIGKLPDGQYAAPVLPTPRQASMPGLVMASKRLPTTYILGDYSAPNRTSDDYWSMVIATTTLSDRLFEEVRTKRNLSYAPESSINPNRTSTGFVYVTTTLPDSAVSVMFACIDSMQQHQMPEEELQGQVAQFITARYMSDETNEQQAKILGMYQILTGSWERSQEIVPIIQRLTPADIQAAAKKYMRNINFAVVGNVDKIDKTLFLSR